MEDVVNTVAHRLREARHAQRISLSELSRRSGIAKATLSHLEQGKGNPTLTTLFTLATALRITLGDLIAEADPGVRIVRADEGPILTRPAVDARYIDRIRTGSDLIEVYLLVVEPGRDEDSRPHAAGVYERLFVSRGPLLAGPSDDLTELHTGDYMTFAGDRPHRYVARTRTAEALCLVCYPHVTAVRPLDAQPGGNLD